MIARDLGDDDVADRDRRFEYALVSDRSLVEDCARALLRRIAATTGKEPGSYPRDATRPAAAATRS